MKKRIISCLSMALVCSASFAQLVVNGTNGYVGIKASSSYSSPLTVGGTGDSESKAAFWNSANLYSYLAKGGSWAYGIHSISKVVGSARYLGVTGLSYSMTATNSGRSYGVLGAAGNATNGYNYGVFAGLSGTNNGTALFASSYNEHNQAYPSAIPGRFAGYFVGPVYGTSTFTATEFLVDSDKRFKKNLTHIGRDRSLNQVMKLAPVEYELQQTYITSTTDSATTETALFSEEAAEFGRSHFGLVAQEVEEIYPELVYEDGNGFKSVNYIGLIPMLIQSIQELNAEVMALNSELEVLKNGGRPHNKKSALAAAEANLPSVEQNYPNPMTSNSTIKYYLPETTSVARLHIYDKQGNMVDSYMLTERGHGEVILPAHKFTPGNYVYSLLVDGEIIASKQMLVE